MRAQLLELREESSGYEASDLDAWRGVAASLCLSTREAGVGVGSLYPYFSNKDALVVRLAEEMGDNLVALCKALADAPIEFGFTNRRSRSGRRCMRTGYALSRGPVEGPIEGRHAPLRSRR